MKYLFCVVMVLYCSGCSNFSYTAEGYPLKDYFITTYNAGKIVGLRRTYPEPKPIYIKTPIFPVAYTTKIKTINVWVELVVKTDGTVVIEKVFGVPHEDFAKEICKVAPYWRFEPGEYEGVKVPSRIRIELAL